jgi:hypothetical protein
LNERLETTTTWPAAGPACAPFARGGNGAAWLLPAIVALALIAGVSGCARRRADAAPIAPPAAIPASAPTLEQPSGPLSEPQTRTELPAPQAVPDGAAPAPRGPFAYEQPETAAAPPQPQASKPPARAADTPATPAAPPSAAAPAQVPQLGPLISEGQRQAIEREIDQNMGRTQTALDSLLGRQLTPDQVEGVRRIQEFQRQVKESRATDAALARNISERARLLAEDLVRNVR